MATDKTIVQGFRILPETKKKVAQIAKNLGYEYAERGGSVGRMLDAIARGDLVVVDANEYFKNHRKNK